MRCDRSCLRSLIITLVVLAALASPVPAADFCVSDSTELQAALDDAEANGEHDTIRLIQGTYVVPTGLPFFYGSAEPFGLTLDGDYVEFMNDCARFVEPTPFHTVLDGGGRDIVLWLQVLSDQSVPVKIDSLTIRNGSVTAGGNYAAGLEIFTGGQPIHITVENCSFVNNSSTEWSGALSVSTAGNVLLLNNLFVANESTTNFGTMYVLSNGLGLPTPCLQLINNTIVGNLTLGDTGGVRLAGSCSACYVDNNVMWDNDGDDLDLGTTTSCHLNHNDIGTYVGTPAAVSGHMSLDPGFVGGLGGYRLAPSSPLVDAGLVRLSAPIPTSDLDGLPRIAAGAIDIGAFERQGLFGDGFESGSTSAWSAVVP